MDDFNDLYEKFAANLTKWEKEDLEGHPPCPKCGGEIEIDEGFFCIINSCKICDWSISDMGMI